MRTEAVEAGLRRIAGAAVFLAMLAPIALILFPCLHSVHLMLNGE